MVTIDEIMISDLYTLGRDNTLQDANDLMREKRIRHIPIIDGNKKLLGLVTQRDLLAATSPDADQTRKAMHTPLDSVMVTDLRTVDEHVSLRQAALYLRQHKFGCLPVVNKSGKLLGIVTDTDFVTVAINLLEQLESVEPTEEQELDDEDVDLSTYEEEFQAERAWN